ncbi:unnamed protein product, partial [Rhizoctonia solani]
TTIAGEPHVIYRTQWFGRQDTENFASFPGEYNTEDDQLLDLTTYRWDIPAGVH